MFRGGESTYVSSQLDLLAAACDLYLQTRFPPSDGPVSLERAKEKAMAICDFLSDHGFRGAADDLFSDLDNHFLHHCFTTNRETLPLSLTLIFCGLANRLGLVASLCNFPMRILAFVSADSRLPSSTETLENVTQTFWLDVTAYTLAASDAHSPTPSDPFARRDSWVRERPPVLEREDLVEWVGRMGVPPNDDFWRPAKPGDMVQRAARNVLGSVQRAQIAPRQAQMGQLGQARSAIRQMEVSRRAARVEVQWRELVRVDYAFLSALHGRTTPIEHETIKQRVARALEGHTEVVEDETVWGIVKTWRRESMRALTDAPESWTRPASSPATHFREWMAQRGEDNDWTLTRANLHRRADHWSEHEQQAAKYAAVNAFLRLSTHVNAREVDWIAGFLQSYFMLDVEFVERDFLGIDPEDSDEEAEGSDSSGEASFSANEVRNGREARRGVAGMVTNSSARVVLSRMLRAVRMKDAEEPRVNRRPSSTRKKGARAENTVGYRVGTVFRHRTYRYVGSVLGWDPYCAAPEDWIVNMGVDRLPAPASARRGGRHQPFYHSQVADGTRRYVAEVNVESISGPIWIYGTPPEERGEMEDEVVEEGRVLGGAVHRMLELRGLGEYFRCFDQKRGRLRRCRDARMMFPDDVSDDEEEEEEEQEEEQEARMQTDEEEYAVERLSEDGSW
uniref:Hemimethylated DNA-binding domain-containing protein n=2 Tax=Kalmanozyma brasiliensis (strain GHG001) TaxID=1365824 RepID=V5ELZ5_KALBG